MFLVAYRTKVDDPWTIFKCRRSGEITFDQYRACFEARRLCRAGNAEAQVLRGEEVIARFWRTPRGDVKQEGGIDL